MPTTSRYHICIYKSYEHSRALCRVWIPPRAEKIVTNYIASLLLKNYKMLVIVNFSCYMHNIQIDLPICYVFQKLRNDKVHAVF